MEWAGSNIGWTRGLEYVLSDRPALDAFREWLVSNGSPEPLDLHFATLAYERMASVHHTQAADLAKTIYQRYISLRTGCCTFIPAKQRQEVGLIVKSFGSNCTAPDPQAFHAIHPYVESFLRRQHEQFICSEEFVDAFNRYLSGEDTRPSVAVSSADRRRSRKSGSAGSGGGQTLTAEALLKSRQVRENTLGESAVERMYPAPTSIRQPYVCHATTSQNDSAVSSSFSSGANGYRPARLGSIREEHLRGNPTTQTLPRVEPQNRTEEQFDHCSEDGRKEFVAVLTKKLLREQAKRRRNDETERQLQDIADRKCTVREVVSTADASVNDDEDDVERYVEKMREDSLKASANRSPKTNALSPGRYSPERERSKSGGASSNNGFMSMSYVSYPGSRTNQFAPPPHNTFNTSSGYYKDSWSSRPIYDSSGVASMAPSGISSEGSRHGRRIPSSTTTPRKTRRSQHTQLLTISYKGSDGVPVVAHVPTSGGQISLKEFRRHFSISSHANVQFFFKTDCEDGSAPYQLLLINDDSQSLPLFQGRVTAELKSYSPE